MAFTLEQHFPGPGKNVVDLLEVIVLVMVGGLATLQSMAGESTQTLETVSLVIGIAFNASQSAPVDGT